MNKPRTNALNDLPMVQNQATASPEDLGSNDAFNQAIERDFGGAINDTGDGFSRRRWLQLMGASLALGSVAGCRYEEEKIAAFAFRPQNRIPGIPQKFATFTELGGVAEPLLATSFDGRPIKLDGNPKHPESKGGSSAFSQARILEFYDPDRLRRPLQRTDNGFTESTFEKFVAACQFGSDLKQTAVLAAPTSSPSLLRLKQDFEKQAGAGQWFTFATINDDNSRAGAKLAFGENLRVHADMSAQVVVTIDADPLSQSPGNIANAIDFASARDADAGQMNRLYAIESQFTHTGAAADHRLAVSSRNIAGFVGSLLAAVEGDAPAPTKDQPYRQRVFSAMVADLKANQGSSAVICGESQPPEVHAVVHRINDLLKNSGKTITFTRPPEADRPGSLASIQALVEKLNAGEVQRVVILGGNPVYDAPRELKLGQALGKAKVSAHVSYYKNETSLACQWVSAVAHPLESWKDATTYRGSTLIGQPLIDPLHGGTSELETLAALMGIKDASGQAMVRSAAGLESDDKKWLQAVHDGGIADSQAEPVSVSVTLAGAPSVDANDCWAQAWDGESFELVFKPSNSVYDGQFANNAWLQELPDFFTKIAWDNVAQISPNTAAKLGVSQHGMGAKSTAQMINIKVGEQTVRVPIAIQPGQADGSIGLAIGFGRTAAGRVGGDTATGIDPVGQDVVPLRCVQNWQTAIIEKQAVDPTGTRYQLAIVQEPWAIDKIARDEIQTRMFRDNSKPSGDRSSLIREGSLQSFQAFRGKYPELFEHGGHDHDEHREHEEHSDRAANGKTTGAGGALPILNQVSYSKPTEDHHDEAGAEDHQDHGHEHHWPEAFHMHHRLFDLTEGVRENYAQENPAYTNMWGKSIDLNKCIGCNSCVVACQSENNIPVVGKAEVWRGRELHWIRIDRYYGENLYTDSDPAKDNDYQMVQQPVACHHCENAPCETVCPVAATVHSNEGLNDMVYNRCIGTRYCGNNCPYKVRRFNFLNYSDAKTFIKYPGADKLEPADLQLQSLLMNPEVSIRSRGVMEKCTYCVQRIQNKKIEAKNEGRRPIGPNEITTACQDACPTSAIKFGDLNNLDSEVRKAHDNPRAYSMLEELNNRPRTKYLARVRNPHPALIDFDDTDSHHGNHSGGDQAHDSDRAQDSDEAHDLHDGHSHETEPASH